MKKLVNTNIDFYNHHASDLLVQYESTSFTAVHGDWLHLLPKSGDVLDVGAGSGRDSAFMACQGLHVIAVEPAQALRTLAANTHTHPNITWLNDTLPALSATVRLNQKFDLILLSAVWMHLSCSQRKTAMPILCSLLKPNASIIITLRHGPSSDQRTMHLVSASEIQALINDAKFTYSLLTQNNNNNADTLGRKAVSWQTVQVKSNGHGE